jgi:hypothetical protein
MLGPNDNIREVKYNRGEWNVDVYVTDPGDTQARGPFTVVVPGNEEFVPTGTWVRKGSLVRVIASGRIDFVGAGLLDADGDDWPPSTDHNAPSLRRHSLICKVDERGFRFLRKGTFEPLKIGDHIRVVGRWLIENAHPDNGYIFPELHPFYFNRIQAIEDVKPSETVEETISVAAPIYERVTDDTRNVLIADDGSDFHTSVTADATILAPALEVGFTSEADLIEYEESVLVASDTPDTVRTVTRLSNGIRVVATVSGNSVDGPAQGVGVFQARYRVRWKSRLSAPSLKTMRTPVNQPLIFEIDLSNDGPDPLSIQPRIEPPEMRSIFHLSSGDLLIQGRSTSKVNGTFMPPYEGRFEAAVVVTSNDPSGRSPAISLRGFGGDTEAVISIQPSAYDFGRVMPGESRDAVFRIRNTGRRRMSVYMLAVTGLSFAVVGDIFMPMDVEPSSSVAVTLRFAPEMDVGYIGELTVTSSAVNENPVVVTLRGEGGDPCGPIEAELENLRKLFRDPTITRDERLQIAARIADLEAELRKLGCTD